MNSNNLSHLQKNNDSRSAITTISITAKRKELPPPLPFRPLISANCLIIPVFFGIWWFWVRRKATSVFHKLLIKDQQQGQEHRCQDDQEEKAETRTYAILDAGSKSADWNHAIFVDDDDENDQFSTWEQVMSQNSDPSIRFVRWVKSRDAVPVTTEPPNHGCRPRKRRIVDTRNTQRMEVMDSDATGSSLATPIMTTGSRLDDGTVLSDAEAYRNSLELASPAFALEDRPGPWQYLQDASLVEDGVELCARTTV